MSKISLEEWVPILKYMGVVLAAAFVFLVVIDMRFSIAFPLTMAVTGAYGLYDQSETNSTDPP